jgi:UDP-N-acetylglucosamine--N-acetylmuramyl-(pentapeptide) pyrophosphoryl-undecaprenol N-acetylglucosamine transferase
VVLAGGGTAGHAVPALAVAEALVRRGVARESVRFVGSTRGLEARLVPEAGFEIILLPGRGIPRRLSVTALRSVLSLGVATARAVGLMLWWRPRAVLAVGGYASLPCAFAAVVLRIPLVVEEQNAVPGATNRLVGRFARAAAVAFPGTALPRAVVTGRPVPRAVEEVDRSLEGRRSARRALGLPEDGFVLGVTGGSLGARRINEAAVELAELWAASEDRCIYHVIGSRDFLSLPRPGNPAYRPVEYESRMPLLLSACDVMVGRSGGWVAELAVAGVPSVLVPLPNAPGDHQVANGRAMQAAGAAVMVADADCTGSRLAEVLEPLVSSPSRVEEMSAAAHQLAQPGAAERVADLLLENGRP